MICSRRERECDDQISIIIRSELILCRTHAGAGGALPVIEPRTNLPGLLVLVVTHSRSHETPSRKMIFRGNKIIFDKAEGDSKEVNKC